MQDPFIYNIAEICAQLKVNDIILSPGSRCAPLTIAFNRHPDINIRSISDERSAAYMALGVALGTNKPVGLVCTSGTASANYLPAITEAFYQKVPLVVFTADRPPEWINQQDNQAIQQHNIYGKHVKEFYQLPVDLSHPDAKWQMIRNVSEAINLANEYPQGPVHINVPVREPFYPKKDQVITFDKVRLPNISLNNSNSFDLPDLKKSQLQQYSKIVIVGGQQKFDNSIKESLSSLVKKGVTVIGDIISNLHEVDKVITHQDTFLPNFVNNEILRPELLITFGDNILSKNLKVFFRKNKPDSHWHIQPAGKTPDTFQSLTDIIRATPAVFLNYLSGYSLETDNNFNSQWTTPNETSKQALNEYFQQSQKGELAAVNAFLQQLPENVNLHLANSMSVRYANFIGLASKKDVKVFSNRGTSGIDGSNSTAVGIALSDPTRQNYLLTGDMAFLYDRNAFWHNYELNNLKIIVINNAGGGIFRLIDGPATLPELEDLFETKQKLTGEYLAKEHSFTYLRADEPDELKFRIKYIEKLEFPCVVEYFSEGKLNYQAFKEFKEAIRNAFTNNP